MKMRILLVIVLLLGTVVLGMSPALAATVSWNTDTTGAWNNPANWAGGNLPTGSDDAVLNGNGTATLTTAVSYSGSTTIRSGATLRVGGGIESPPEGAALWLDASNAASVLNASLAPASAGQTVAQWNNLMNTGSVAQQDGCVGPVYGTNTINGIPVLSFNGSQSLTSSGSAYTTSNNPHLTAFVVQRRTVNDGNTGRIISCSNGIADYNSTDNWVLDNGYNGGDDFVVERGGYNDQGLAPAVGTAYMSEVVFDGSTCATYVNGTQIGDAFASPWDFNITRTVVGGGWAGSFPYWFFNGDIGEVLIYNSTLTAEQRQATEAYLAQKWLGGAGVGGNNKLPTTTAMTIDAGGTYDLNGGTQTLASIAGEGSITLGPGTLTVNSTANVAYAGPISGSGGSLVFNGANKLTLSGANSFTGATTVNGGTLEGSSASLPSAIALASGANVTFAQATDGTHSAAITGAGSLTKSGAGKLVLAGANTYDGTTTVTDGTLEGSGASLPGAVALENNANVTFNQTSNDFYSGAVTGTGSMTKTGDGVLTFGGVASTYSGDTAVTGGTLRLTPVAAPRGSVVRLDASTLNLANGAAVTTLGDLSGHSNNAVAGNYGKNGTVTYNANSLNGNGTIHLNDFGNLTTANPLGITGDSDRSVFVVMRHDAGTNDRMSFFTGTPWGPTFAWDSSSASLNFVRWDPPAGDGPNYNMGARPADTFEAYGLTHNSATHDTIGYANGAVIGTVNSTLNTSNGPAIIGSFTPDFDFCHQNGDFAEAIVYDRLLSDTERGQVDAYLNYKWFGIGGMSNVLPTTTSVAISAGSTLDINGIEQTVAGISGEGNIALGKGTLTVNGSGDSTFAGVISGAGSLTKDGNGKLTVTGANNYSGTTTVNGGTLEGSVASIPTAVNLANNANVTYNEAADVSLARPVTGTGSLTKTGNGVLTIEKGSTYDGATRISGGTLRLADAPPAAPTGAILQLDASTLSLADGAAVATLNDLSGNSNNATAGNYGQTGAVTFSAGSLNGKGTIHFADHANLTTASALGITGDADRSVFFVTRRSTVNEGGASRMAFTTGMPWVGNGVFGSDSTAKVISLPYNWAADTAYTARGENTFEIYGMTHNGESHDSNGYANGTLLGALNATLATVDGPAIVGSFTDADWCIMNGDFAEALVYNRLLSDEERGQVETYLNYKWFGIQPPASNVVDVLPTNTAVTVDAGSALDLNNTSQTVGALAGEGDVTLGTGTLTVASSADSAFAGTISGDGTFVKDGASTLVLSGANSYQGGTVVNNGTLQIDSADALASDGGMVVGENGTVVLSSSIGKAVKIRRLTMLVASESSQGGLSATASNSAPVAPVPEPSTIVLLAAGAMALAVAGLRRRNRASRN